VGIPKFKLDQNYPINRNPNNKKNNKSKKGFQMKTNSFLNKNNKYKNSPSKLNLRNNNNNKKNNYLK
jgi:hypothetical protein